MKKKDILYIIFPPLFQSALFFLTKLVEINIHNVSYTIDSKIPYLNVFVVFYVVWYIFLVISPYIIYKFDYKLLKKYALTYMICSFICSFIFIFFPTTIDRQLEFNNNSILDFIVQFIYKNDTPALNCFPSLHALNSILWIKYIGLNKNINKIIRIIVSIISIGVILSTLFIKQHAFVDIIGSILVAVIACNLSSILIKKIAKNTD